MTAKCAAYMGALKNFGTPDYDHGYFSQKFSWDSVPIDHVNMCAKFEVRSFAHSWDNRESPELGVANPNFREGETVRVGDGTVRKSVGEFL